MNDAVLDKKRRLGGESVLDAMEKRCIRESSQKYFAAEERERQINHLRLLGFGVDEHRVPEPKMPAGDSYYKGVWLLVHRGEPLEELVRRFPILLCERFHENDDGPEYEWIYGARDGSEDCIIGLTSHEAQEHFQNWNRKPMTVLKGINLHREKMFFALEEALRDALRRYDPAGSWRNKEDFQGRLQWAWNNLREALSGQLECFQLTRDVAVTLDELRFLKTFMTFPGSLCHHPNGGGVTYKKIPGLVRCKNRLKLECCDGGNDAFWGSGAASYIPSPA